MLKAVTDYLLQYRQVTIPFIGSFELKHVPAQLDFASRLILSPSTTVVYASNDEVSEQQLIDMRGGDSLTADEIKVQLQTLGKQLRSSLANGTFQWHGIGQLEQEGTALLFHSTLEMKLAPVAAHKVMRENVSHAVTVGDKEIQSHEAGVLLQDAPEKSYVMIFVWVLIALALLFISYIIYANGFSPLSSGSRQQVGLFNSLTVLVS